MTTLMKQTIVTAMLTIGVVGLSAAQESAPTPDGKKVEKIIEVTKEKNKGFSIKLNIDDKSIDADFGEKLSEEIEKELKKEFGNLSDKNIDSYVRDRHDWDESFGKAVMIPIVAIVFSLGMPIFIVGFILLAKHKRRKMMHETIAKMVEKGVEIPPELLQEQGEAPSKPGSALRTGIILVGVGFGLMGFFGLDGDMDGIGIGFIPLMIGVAYLVAWKLESKPVQ